jgi:hypothetical protein
VQFDFGECDLTRVEPKRLRLQLAPSLLEQNLLDNPPGAHNQGYGNKRSQRRPQ